MPSRRTPASHRERASRAPDQTRPLLVRSERRHYPSRDDRIHTRKQECPNSGTNRQRASQPIVCARWPFRIVYLTAFAGATESARCRVAYVEISAQVLLVPLLPLGLEGRLFRVQPRPNPSRDGRIVYLAKALLPSAVSPS